MPPEESPHEFLGQYQHTLDAKGRVVLPAAFRGAFAEGLVMTLGIGDRCISLHPRADWDRVMQSLNDLRSTDRRQRDFARMLTANAHAETLDRQGRITIPVRLREHGDLVGEIAVVGQGSKVELWNQAAWDDYSTRAMAELAGTDEAFNVGIF